ncbi:tyrosine-type recombinase/integrase [Actinomadura citrea]|uniref:tyrosine-type recombinase/integrase n=1 Tax=Actinomadura citrea TaxID=46158 RepID=UPI003CE4A88A
MPTDPGRLVPPGPGDSGALAPTALLRAPLPEDPPGPALASGPSDTGPHAPVPVRGKAPARTPAELARLLEATLLETARPEGAAAARGATAGWLAGERRRSPRTRDGYIRDVSWWLTWTRAHGVDPLAAPARQADLYAAAMDAAGLAPATRARRLAAAASWTAYLHRDGTAATNPFTGMDRPKADTRSSTRGAAMDEMGPLLAHARRHESPRTVAVLTLLVATAGRISSITGARLDGLGQHLGYTVLDVPVKGGATQRIRLSAVAIEALREYLVDQLARIIADEPSLPGTPAGSASAGAPPEQITEQTTGQATRDADDEVRGLDLLAAAAALRARTPHRPLFTTRTGRPIDRPYVFRLLRRVAAAAGIPGADRLNLHGLRHTVLTFLLAEGTPLHDVQDLAGHADPRTTRRYDDDQGALERSPVDAISRRLRSQTPRPATSDLTEPDI